MADDAEIEALLREAAASHARGALTEADALYRLVLDLDPLHHDAVKHYAVIAAKLGRPEDSLAVLDAAFRADPSNAEWPFGRALVLANAGRRDEAIAAYDQAIALRPEETVYRQGRAGLLTAAGRIEAALADHDAVLALHPELVETLMARGGLLVRLRRYDDALATYDRAIEIQEDFAHAWLAKSLLLLTLGRYAEGWPLYEWRWFVPGVSGQERLFAQPMWDGTPLTGRTLYIHIEQGLGDSIQFYRFVLQAKRLGPVVLGVSTALAPLFSSQPDAPMVVATGQPMPRIDLHCPIMSLPWLLGTDLNSLPTAPYLRADPRRAAAWAARLPESQGLPRVGIAWAGNVEHADDRNRSMPLRTMLAMLDRDATIVSLQKDLTEADREVLGQNARVLDLSDGLTDLAETAAAIDRLDLVITVDTVIAHLAGAMSKPVWVLLPEVAEWRWLLDRADSPWYPSARLFRQQAAGNWASVADRVREALRGWGKRS